MFVEDICDNKAHFEVPRRYIEIEDLPYKVIIGVGSTTIPTITKLRSRYATIEGKKRMTIKLSGLVDDDEWTDNFVNNCNRFFYLWSTRFIFIYPLLRIWFLSKNTV